MAAGEDEPRPPPIVVLDGGRGSEEPLRLREEPPASARNEELETIELQLLTEAVFRRYGLDFRNYAIASLRRRVGLAMHEEDVETISGLTERLLHNPPAMERLLLRLSMNVTAMFRDPGFFLALRAKVIAHLYSYPFVRIWHAGCSTGEEVYSMAILLHEEGLYERCRIYATDFNEVALKRARDGIVSLEHMQEYSTNYLRAGGHGTLSDYYTANYGHAIFRQSLRKNIVFSQHNLATDGSFNEFNLILCRNVMIYFNETLQNRVHQLLYASLRRYGVLGLGRKESLRGTPHERDYEPVDESERIFPATAVTDVRTAAVKVVVVGTSLGGMRALEIILRGLMHDFPLPIAIVQHRGSDWDYQSQLQRLLQLHCALPLVETDDKEPLIGGRVYLAPPDYHLLVEEGRFALSTDDRVFHARPSIDVLFESAADSYREGVLGVILTGANADGAHGAACIKRRGGSVIAQDPRTAEAPAMPEAAIAAGAVDTVLPLDEIAPFLNLAGVNRR